MKNQNQALFHTFLVVDVIRRLHQLRRLAASYFSHVRSLRPSLSLNNLKFNVVALRKTLVAV